MSSRTAARNAAIKPLRPQTPLASRMLRNWELYLMILPVLAYYIIFHYAPMYGIQIAFKDFFATKGITGSPFVGLKHFNTFFNGAFFSRTVINTIMISLTQLVFAFPAPILFALMLNEIRNSKLKRSIQTITYAPHFISVIVLVAMITTFLHPSKGILNHLVEYLGGERVYFMQKDYLFRPIYVISGIWQNIGFGSIVYIASLSGVDPELHEAAVVDGANRVKRIWHINIPHLLPTISILLILNIGGFMSVGFEKAFLMQNSLNMSTSDIISTYVYRLGIQQGRYSFSAAVGLFNSVINFSLLATVNFIARRMGSNSLW